MSIVTLNQARAIIAGAFKKAGDCKLAPLSVAVLDAGGHLIAFERSDGSSNMRAQIAIAKANGALSLGVSSRKIGLMAVERPAFVGAISNLSPGGLLPAAGGVIIVDGGVSIGAVGVTGDSSDNDEICALAGIEAAGLTAQA